MTGQTFTGEKLVEALGSDELAASEIVLVGMVKAGKKGDHVSYSPDGCETWLGGQALRVIARSHGQGELVRVRSWRCGRRARIER